MCIRDRVIDVPADVQNNFEKIINNQEVQDILNKYIVTNGGNVSYNGTTFIYKKEDGTTETIDISSIVKANETVTTLVEKNGVLTYTNEANSPVNVDVASLVRSNETLTVLENVVTQGEDEIGQEIDIYTLTYKDEKGDQHPIDIKVLVKGTETVTTLVYDPVEHVLVYKNEKGEVTSFKLTDLVGDAESITKLEFDSDTNTLLYTDEDGIVHSLDLTTINKHPWYDSITNKPALTNTSNIYTKGWVGIGFTEPSASPNEKLRVNGSITAVNSYYADYVFEKYFDGYSSLKYDYNFKTLDAVEHFIKENRHLPGITPVSQLSKSEEGYAFNVSELSIQLLEKTEELYLHIIDQNKELEEKELRIKHLENSNLENQQKAEKQNNDLQKRVDQLEQMILELMKKN